MAAVNVARLGDSESTFLERVSSKAYGLVSERFGSTVTQCVLVSYVKGLRSGAGTSLEI